MRGRPFGFTLIEILIALAIFATVATTVYTRAGDSVYQLQILEQRALAHWLASNATVRVQLEQERSGKPPETASDSQTEFMASREWRIKSEITETEFPLMHRLQVQVFVVEEGREEGPVETLVSFLGTH